jgi:hypothetical protein
MYTKAMKVDRSGFGFTHYLFLTQLDEWADKKDRLTLKMSAV